MQFLRRLWALFRREHVERDLQDEMQQHFDLKVQEHIASGMSPEQARRTARLEFGNVALAQEQTREKLGFPLLESILHDLRYSLRQLRNNPGFTGVAVLTLALGIGANTAIFTVLHGVLLQPLPFREPERLFLISSLRPRPPIMAESLMQDRHYVEYEKAQRSFEPVGTFGQTEMTLTGAGDPVRVTVQNVTAGFLTTLRVAPELGRTFLPEDELAGRDHVVLLSDRLWQRHWGRDRRVLGGAITLDGLKYEVIGIMPPGLAFPADAELATPLHVEVNAHTTWARLVVGRLKPGVSPSTAQAELAAIINGVPLGRGEQPKDRSAEVVPLKELLVGNARKSLMIFAGAVAFVLLIACANVANLLLMRASGRRREIAVRDALGATRARLIRQLLTESLVVAVGGGAVGILLAIWIVPALLALAPAGSIPRVDEIHVGLPVLLFTLAVSLLTGIVFGMAPALQATRRDLRVSMSTGGYTVTFQRQRLRSSLVAGEIALALMLLTGAGLLLRSFVRIRTVDPGFQPDHVLAMTVDLPDSLYRDAGKMNAFHAQVLERLSALPGVDTAAVVNWRPMSDTLIKGDFQIERGQFPPDFSVDKLVISPSYFRALGIRLLRGREFNAGDGAAAPGVIIISQSVARRVWPNEDPLGRRIAMEDHPKPQDWLTVVGVVEDVRQQGLTSEPDAATYQPYPQVAQTFFVSHMTYISRTAGDPAGLAQPMRNVLRAVDKNQPIQSLATFTDLVAGTMVEPRFQMGLLGSFSLLAMVLAAIGIYGVMAYSVTERTREIGIRMALGAQRHDVLRMMLRQTLRLAVIGVVLGIGGALATTRVLAKWLFEIQPTDSLTFASVILALASVALLAGLLPARRATKVDPMVALRCE